VKAQPDAEGAEVPIIKKFGARRTSCVTEKNGVIDEEKFRQIAARKDCANLGPRLDVDFQQETLIGFKVYGDCFVRAAAKVFRHDHAKKYTVRIKNISGGCRATGAFQGWLVVEKTRPGYEVEFVETRIDFNEEISDDEEISFLTLQTAQKTKPVSVLEILQTGSIDLKGCIQTVFNQQFVIKDRETYLKTIRRDASRDWCLENLEKIDFDKNTLLGLEINSGYCGLPAGLKYQTVKNEAEKQYRLTISYIDPQGQVCRALSQYDLWLLVPKLPAGYAVIFDLKAWLPVENKRR
jgi:hypothetical protein